MYDKISRLLMYGDLTEESILYQLGKAIDKIESGDYNKNYVKRFDKDEVSATMLKIYYGQ